VKQLPAGAIAGWLAVGPTFVAYVAGRTSARVA
jgi:hypothetical protein